MSASVSEQRDRGPFSTDVLATLTLFLLVPLNPAAARVVNPTPGIPAVTSRAGASLSFVFLIPPATSRQLPAAAARSWSSWSQSGSSERTGAPFQSGGARSPRVCPLPRAGGYHFPAPKRGGSLPLPFIFRYLCAVSRLPASYSILSAGDVHL